VELTGPTRAGAYRDEKAVGPLMLQGDHGPVAYRNIWLAPAGPNPFFALDTGTKDEKHQTAAEQAQMLKDLGYVGIAVGYEGREALAGMLAELDKRDLRLFAMYTYIRLDEDQEPYDPSLTDALHILQGRNTILWLLAQSKKHPRSSPNGDARAVQIIGKLADAAAKHQVRIALYPHHNFWLERVADAVRVANEVDRANVGVTFNLCHWLRVSDQTDAGPLLKAAMPRLFVVTINGADSDGQDWKSLIQTLDRGSFDLKQFLTTLKNAGYTGPIGFQGYAIGGDAYDNLKRSMAAWERDAAVLYYSDMSVTPFGEPNSP
jgi:sugar phosphate isomerase/epimerase